MAFFIALTQSEIEILMELAEQGKEIEIDLENR